MRPFDVSAVIVTRGNMDLTPVLDSLQAFDEVVVWDNSVEEEQMTYGRVRALNRVRNSVVYSQDDDIIHSPENQRAILNAYQPGVLTGCMWPEWSDGARRQGIPNGYDDLVFAGSGSVYDRDLPTRAAARYLQHYPLDDFFLLWSDTIIGILAPNQQLPLEFDSLPEADATYRMSWLPNGVAEKTEAIRRAREVRDRKPGWHDLRVAAAEERIARSLV